jgi:hypothetical protein
MMFPSAHELPKLTARIRASERKRPDAIERRLQPEKR